ncbi:hypothetical protein LLG46_00110 [bacterium]|nr:hypothetical protein [bacterium]
MPPRAKDRTLGQKVGMTLENVRGFGMLRRDLERSSQRAKFVLERLSCQRTWLTPKTFGLILLSAVPGIAHIYIVGRKLTGLQLLTISMVLVVLTVTFIRSSVSGWFMYCLLALSMFSMSAAICTLRPGRRDISNRSYVWIGIGLIVFCLYCGNYWVLRIAAAPFMRVMTVVAEPYSTDLKRGDTLLLWSAGNMKRGDTVVGLVRWNDYHVLSIGQLVGSPGDRIEIGSKVRVNGQIAHVRLPPIAGAHGEALAPSSYNKCAKALAKNEYWIVPNFNYAPSVRDILDAGTISRSNILGRVIAITGPPEHRKIIGRKSATGK